MAELNTDVHIFLSSTFIDLKELRERIANRLRDVFGAHLLIMETSGSDDAPPVISSVRRVREADIFIGVYARRYGYIDAASGRSITELELREAERSLSAWTLTAILLYWLEDNASWPTNTCETGLAAVAKLAALTKRALSATHLYTFLGFLGFAIPHDSRCTHQASFPHDGTLFSNEEACSPR